MLFSYLPIIFFLGDILQSWKGNNFQNKNKSDMYDEI